MDVAAQLAFSLIKLGTLRISTTHLLVNYWQCLEAWTISNLSLKVLKIFLCSDHRPLIGGNQKVNNISNLAIKIQDFEAELRAKK